MASLASREVNARTVSEGQKPTFALGSSPNYESITSVRSYHQPWYTNWRNWIKITVLLAVLAFLVLAVVYSKTTQKYFNSFLEWMEDNAAMGAFAFIGVYWFCTVFMV